MVPLALIAPRYWPTWLVIACFFTVAQWPWRVQRACGRIIGRLAYRLAHRRRAITEHNLAACFPELGESERGRLARRHFEALGIGLIETAVCWWTPEWRLRKRVEIHGLEHLEQAAARHKGVLMLTAHFTTLELGGRMLSSAHPVMAVYRPHENAVIDYLMRKRRNVRSAGVIRRGDLRTMIRRLRQDVTIWYAPDQAYLGARSVDAPFFGVSAPTNTATSRIAALTHAPVVPFFVTRLESGRYRLEIRPALNDFPSGDDLADTTRINKVLEEGIRLAPEQYLWSHDRFKQFRRP